MISSNDSLRVVSCLVISGLLLGLVGCDKGGAARTDPAPLSKLVVESQPEAEAESPAAAPVAETPPGADEVESAAADMAPRGEATESAEAPSNPSPRNQEPNGAAKPPLEIPPAPEYVSKPKVFLSAGHMKTCLVHVGEPMPAFELPDLAGATHKLPDLLGERFTVVVFWSSKNLLGLEQIQRLPAEVAGPFGSSGVNVVAINSGDETGQIEALLPVESDRGFVVLADESGTALASVATEHLPRTYLLDAEGRILWLDLEYSRATARELINALHFFLENGSGNDS